MAFSGENLALAAPAVTLSAFVADLTGSATAPAPSLAASGGGVWDGAVAVSVPSLRGPRDFGWRAEIAALSPALTASILPGSTGTGVLRAPLPQLVATISASGQAVLAAPAPALAASGYTEIVWTAALAAPSPALTAVYVVPVGVTFDTWSMNARTLRHSAYTSYPFTSFFRLGNAYYGCAGDGVYLLEGDTDAGVAIDARTTHGISDFGTEFLKLVDSAYLNARASGDLQMVVTVDETEQRTYTADVTAEGLSPVRVKVAKGLQGRNWQVGFKNVAGSRFTLSEACIEFIKLSRRV